MDKKMISIISSFYRTDRYLDKFSRHLENFAAGIKQAGALFEFIVIANDPTGREREFAKQFQGQSWFFFHAVGRESVFASFNRGINLAKGGIIGFWNGDDVRFVKAVIEAQNLFAKGAEMVYFPFVIKRYIKVGQWSVPLPARRVDKEIPEFNPKTFPEFTRSMIYGPFFMFTKNLYDRVGPFDEQFKIAGDFDWCARAAYKTDKLVKAKSLGGIFRVDGGGLSAGLNPRRTAENNVVYMRNHIWEKLSLAEDLIIKDYRPKHLLKAGNFIPFS